MGTDGRISRTTSTTRRWRRFDFDWPVRVTVEKFRQSSVLTSRGSQINGGGLALLADPELAVGDEAEIQLTEHDLRLRGIVRNQAGNHYGVKFIATTAEEAEHLALFRQLLTSKVGRLDVA